jgi:hypothetical protein
MKIVLNLKKLFFLFLIGFLSATIVSGQAWVDRIPARADGKKPSFLDHQKAFYDYWKGKQIDHNGYYVENGIRKKAAGWKQFKRWEWEMERKIDYKTGYLPNKTAFEIYKEYQRNNRNGARATTASWTNLGPNSSTGGYAGVGRLNCVAFHPTDPNTYWVGAPAGGLWRTNNGGSTWTVLTDQNPVLGISDILIPSNFATSNTIYLATGDKNALDNNSVGVLKSTDGGNTWNTTGLSFNIGDGRRVTKLLQDPNDPNTILASTSIGVYKTTNGGASWTQLTTLAFADLEHKPGDFNTLYGGTLTGGAIHMSSNGGTSWTQVFVNSQGRRVELAVTPADPTIVYAIIGRSSNHGLLGIYTSANLGTSFNTTYTGPINMLGWEQSGTDSGGQAWYDLCIDASPTNANTLLVGGVNTWRSTNGGTAWSIVNHWTGGDGSIPAVHADKHMLRYRPSDGLLFECNDGGVYTSTNNGTAWTDRTNGMIISQMYKLGNSVTVPGVVVAGLQDNGTKQRTSTGTWRDVLGGDGMECAIDYTDINVQYGCIQSGELRRTTNDWASATNIKPPGQSGAWVTPYVIHPTNPQILFSGYSNVYRSVNRGTSWTAISTINSSDRLRNLVVAQTNDQVIYTSDQFNFYRTTNGGTNWDNLTSSLPTAVAGLVITSIAIKSNDPNHIWMSFGGYNATRVFQSTNGGNTWTDISAGLPNLPIYSVIQNTQITTETHLYAGSELGVYFKKGNDNWIAYNTNLANVQIGELEIFYNTANPENSILRAATFGRGLWETPVYFSTGGGPTVTVPASVQATDGTFTDKVRVTWTGTSGNWFRVYRNTTNDSGTAAALGSWQNTTTYDDASAVAGTTYHYWVRAASDNTGANISAFSTGDTGFRATSGPTVTVPASVQASDGTFTDKVRVTWTGTSGNWFRVYRNTTNDSGTSTALGSWQNTTTYDDASAVAGTTYHYWVRASSDNTGANISAFSTGDAGFRALPPGTVTIPTNVQATDGAFSDKVQITWSGTSGNWFRVFRSTSNNSSRATALGNWQTGMTFDDSTVPQGTTFWYFVRAAADNAGANTSAFSTGDSGFRTFGGPTVTVPANVQATDGTFTDKVRVTWTGTSGNWFRVYRNTTNDSGTSTALGSWQNTTTYDDASAVAGTTYHYWVRAASDNTGANISAFSTGDTGFRATSGPVVTVPASVQASDGTFTDKVQVTWTGTAGNWFRVYRNTTNDSGTSTALGSWQNTTTYDDASAVAGTTYHYWVRAASDNSGANISAFSTGDTGFRATSGPVVTVPASVQASDGTFTDKVQVTWTGTSGNWFRVYRNTINDSGTATALGSWQNTTTYDDASAVAGTTYHYWVRAASDNSGANISAFSTGDTGFRASPPGTVTVPANVQASDGTFSDRVRVTWTGTSGNWFRVYRSNTNNISRSTALGSWQNTMSYDDFTPNVGTTYFYWVRAASDNGGSNISAFSTGNSGFRVFSGSIINNGSNQDQIKSVENILQVFPNPANTSSNFIINSSLMQEADGNIIILDVAGKIVKELRYSADQKIFIETPEKPGIFIVMIKSDNGKSEKTRLAVE